MLSEKTILAVAILKKSAAGRNSKYQPTDLEQAMKRKIPFGHQNGLRKKSFLVRGTWSRSLDSLQEKFTSFSR